MVQLTAKQHAEVTRLQGQMAHLRQINSEVLALAYAMWIKHESYESATFLAARHAHGKLAT